MGDSVLNLDVVSVSTQETGIEKNDCKNNNDGKHDKTNEKKHNTCIWILSRLYRQYREYCFVIVKISYASI